MSKARLVLVLLAAGFAPALRAEAPKTVCTITVNSDDEKETFRKRLPPGRYHFVELLQKGRDDWLQDACRKEVHCDVLMVSGHFNAGETFYSDKVDVEESLNIDQLERASCSQSCPALFGKLKEVYLFGCESLNPDATKYSSSYGESGRDRMRRIFANVPSIYGFYASAPVGPTAAMLLNRYFDGGGSPRFATGQVNPRLLQMFSRNHMTRVAGLRDGEPGSAARARICGFFDDRSDAARKVAFVHDLLRRDPAQAQALVPRIESLFAQFSEHDRASPSFASALARLSADDATRDRFLGLARAERSATMRYRMVALADRFGWLAPEAKRDEEVALLDALLAQRTLGFGDVDLACTVGRELRGAAARVRPPAARGVAGEAALACLGSGAARKRVLAALASETESDVQIAQLYLRHRPVSEPAELRALVEDVSRMPPSAAQVRALGALARLHIADRGVLDELAQAFTRAKTVNVQRAIAEVFIRSDPDKLPKPELATILRDHRIQAPDGHPDLIDALLRQLAS